MLVQERTPKLDRRKVFRKKLSAPARRPSTVCARRGIIIPPSPLFFACMNSTPVSLLEQLRRPNADEAWARFVALYTPLLYYWVRRSGALSNEAADVVQDVFLILVK